MTSPQDLPPTTTKTQPQLHLNTDPPGKLAVVSRAWTNTPPRVKFAWLGGALGILTLTTLVLATRTQEPTIIQTNRGAELFLLSQTTPTALAGITADTPPDIALQQIYAVMPEFEQLLNAAQATHYDQLITAEAHRMANAALHEVQTGQVNVADPVAEIDLTNCVYVMEPQKCVLIRYAGDAIAQLDAANRAGDIYAATAANIRFRAALLALAPPPVQVPDANPSLQGMLNMRVALYDLLRLLPTAQPVGQHFATPTGNLTPAANLEAQFPAP